jgi:hypothetical protein
MKLCNFTKKREVVAVVIDHLAQMDWTPWEKHIWVGLGSVLRFGSSWTRILPFAFAPGKKGLIGV